MPEESKLKSVKNKVEQQSDRIRPDVVAIVAVVLIILVYIGVEVHKVTHIDVKTITATQSVVYETIEAKALVVRDESAQLEPRRFLRTDVFRHPGAAGEGAVDQHPRCFQIDRRDVVERLDDHPHHQHQQRGKHERRK